MHSPSGSQGSTPSWYEESSWFEQQMAPGEVAVVAPGVSQGIAVAVDGGLVTWSGHADRQTHAEAYDNTERQNDIYINQDISNNNPSIIIDQSSYNGMAYRCPEIPGGNNALVHGTSAEAMVRGNTGIPVVREVLFQEDNAFMPPNWSANLAGPVLSQGHQATEMRGMQQPFNPPPHSTALESLNCDWNRLKQSTVNAQNIDSFKKGISEYLKNL